MNARSARPCRSPVTVENNNDKFSAGLLFAVEVQGD